MVNEKEATETEESVPEAVQDQDANVKFLV